MKPLETEVPYPRIQSGSFKVIFKTFLTVKTIIYVTKICL